MLVFDAFFGFDSGDFFLGIALHCQVAAQEGQKSAKILLLHACKRLLPAFSQL
jgi:hypothetical protein